MLPVEMLLLYLSERIFAHEFQEIYRGFGFADVSTGNMKEVAK